MVSLQEPRSQKHHCFRKKKPVHKPIKTNHLFRVEKISENATVCPHCGEPVLKKKKTSIWTWLVLVLFILYIAGEVGDKSTEINYISSTLSKHTTTKKTNHRGSGCSVEDFTIKQSSGWREGRYYKIPFSVTNNCVKAAGVKIQMSFYGKNNTLLNIMTG